MTDKRMTEDDVVAELRDGHDDRHRRLGHRAASRCRSCGRIAALRPDGPHRRQLRRPRRRPAVRRRQGAQGSSTRFVSLDSIPLEPHFRAARQAGAIEDARARRGHVPARACRPRRGGCRSCPTRVGLGSDLLARQPEIRTVTLAVRRRRGAGRRAGAAPRRRPRAHEPGRRARQRPVPRPDLYFDDLFLGRRRARFLSRRADRAHRGPRARTARSQTLRISRLHGRRRGRGAERRALHRRACPTTTATRRSRRSTPRPPTTPEAWAAFERRRASTAATSRVPGRWSGS